MKTYTILLVLFIVSCISSKTPENHTTNSVSLHDSVTLLKMPVIFYSKDSIFNRYIPEIVDISLNHNNDLTTKTLRVGYTYFKVYKITRLSYDDNYLYKIQNDFLNFESGDFFKSKLKTSETYLINDKYFLVGRYDTIKKVLFGDFFVQRIFNNKAIACMSFIENTISGFAVNDTNSAIIITRDSTIYHIGEIKKWDDDYINKMVTVRGKILHIILKNNINNDTKHKPVIRNDIIDIINITCDSEKKMTVFGIADNFFEEGYIYTKNDSVYWVENVKWNKSQIDKRVEVKGLFYNIKEEYEPGDKHRTYYYLLKEPEIKFYQPLQEQN